jgi:hypothetical protein
MAVLRDESCSGCVSLSPAAGSRLRSGRSANPPSAACRCPLADRPRACSRCPATTTPSPPHPSRQNPGRPGSVPTRAARQAGRVDGPPRPARRSIHRARHRWARPARTAARSMALCMRWPKRARAIAAVQPVMDLPTMPMRSTRLWWHHFPKSSCMMRVACLLVTAACAATLFALDVPVAAQTAAGGGRGVASEVPHASIRC